MKIRVPKQTEEPERRVALIPAVVKKAAALGAQIVVESGAGLASGYDDDAYREAGAEIESDSNAVWSASPGDVVLIVQPPTAAQAQAMARGSVLLGSLSPMQNLPLIRALAGRGVTVFSAEFIPRISRAQPHDVLSSQANLAGYQAVLLAAAASPKIFPMLMTAAGTVAPARVFVLGAGVAGLQAIATARRLGAVVEAYDVRPVVKEQVQSLGARFVELPMTKTDAQTAGGYAKEQTDEDRRQQAELMAKHVTAADAVIATAAIFGKSPPMLIPRAVVEKMQRGSVIVDMAADPASGRGNCEATKPGEDYITANGVRVIGLLNLPSLVPVHASQVLAANFHAFLKEIVAGGALKLNLEDEIQKGALIAHDGRIVNEMVAKAAG